MFFLMILMDKNCIVIVLKYKILVGDGEKGKMIEGEVYLVLFMCLI